MKADKEIGCNQLCHGNWIGEVWDGSVYFASVAPLLQDAVWHALDPLYHDDHYGLLSQCPPCCAVVSSNAVC